MRDLPLCARRVRNGPSVSALKLVDTTTCSSGVVLFTYQPTDPGETASD